LRSRDTSFDFVDFPAPIFPENIIKVPTFTFGPFYT
jgi:hypothetical protein